MSLDLCASTRAWVARPASPRELVDPGDRLKAEGYGSFVADQHLRPNGVRAAAGACICARVLHKGRSHEDW
jgi:hypothetical protein